MQKIKVGVIGLGFIGLSHVEGIRRLAGAQVVAAADADATLAKRRCDELNIPKCCRDIDEMIGDPEIQVIHNCTPNHLHLEVNRKIIEAGKHVFSEKPLGRSSDESREMLNLLAAQPGVVAGVNFCYRMNPLMLDAKNRIRNGEIGRPLLVHGCYLQDWLLYDTDYNWRIEARYAGLSRCVADIGSHWMDLAQNLLGSRIREVCANTVTAHPTRKKSLAAVETFSKAACDEVEYEEVAVTTEDYAAALLKFENGTEGMFQCSQVSAGRKCCIEIEVDGSEAAYKWEHETSDRMWKGNRDSNNELVMRNPNLMTDGAKGYTALPAGHPEGWNDAFKNNLTAFYAAVEAARQGKAGGPYDFATFEDGHYLILVTEAILKSAREKRWVEVEDTTKAGAVQ